jgi:hypothetical protein
MEDISWWFYVVYESLIMTFHHESCSRFFFHILGCSRKTKGVVFRAISPIGASKIAPALEVYISTSNVLVCFQGMRMASWQILKIQLPTASTRSMLMGKILG